MRFDVTRWSVMPNMLAAAYRSMFYTRKCLIVLQYIFPALHTSSASQACCIMFDEKPKMVDDPTKMGKKVPNYWDAAKRLLADPTKFLDSLISFDKDNIKDAIIQRIQPYIDMEEFTPEAVARVSPAL